MIEFFVFLIFLEQIYAAQAPAQAPMTKTISSTTLTIAPTCDKNAETFKGVAYFTTTTPLVHQEALEFCENIGGSLPIFLNESDWDSYSAYKILKNLSGQITPLGYWNYIMTASSASFKTTNGSGCPVTFSKWSLGQPNFLANQFCLISDWTDLWNDYYCNTPSPVICCCSCIEPCQTAKTTTTSISTCSTSTTTSTLRTENNWEFQLWPLLPFIIFTIATLSCAAYLGFGKKNRKKDAIQPVRHSATIIPTTQKPPMMPPPIQYSHDVKQSF